MPVHSGVQGEIGRPILPTLHLRPLSHDAQRLWQIGGAVPDVREADGDSYVLSVRPDCHENFASLRAIFGQLALRARPEHHADLARLDTYLREAAPDFGAAAADTHGRFLADSVTLAIMRRISRESVYTSRVIETGASVMNAILSTSVACPRVCVPLVDRLDRPTLKVLARAMLLLDKRDRFSWVWHLSTDPTIDTDGATRDRYVTSRIDLLRKLVGILSPTITRHGSAGSVRRPPIDRTRSAIEIASALVVQNYDACFLWADDLLRSSDEAEATEGLRLRALAAVNVGALDDALRDLAEAETSTDRPGRRAHLCYLQGLIDAKRHYSLSRSAAHYERGLSHLAAAAGHTPGREDLNLEYGWLLNGLALNEAILLRKEPRNADRSARAVALEREAFGLVADGGGAARAYLRFNLLANLSLLMEMQGSYDAAIEIFTRTFDFSQSESAAIQRRSRRGLGYRAGVLQYRAGRLSEAHRLLQDAAEQDAGMDNWATQERILRALGTVALAGGAFEQATHVFRTGLASCRAARSAEGTGEHGRGLYSALRLAGRSREADAHADVLAAEEGISVVDGQTEDPSSVRATLRPPSPKLPAYIPEIDLEGIPAIDINRYLGGALAAGDRGAPPWRE